MLALAIGVCCRCVDMKRVGLAIAAHEGRLKETTCFLMVVAVDACSLAARERKDDDVVGRRLRRSRELVGKIIMAIRQSMLVLRGTTTTTSLDH